MTTTAPASEYVSNVTLEEAAAMLRRAQRITVTTHAKPDGDAFGSVVALAAALRGMGRPVEAWFIPPVSEGLRSLRGNELVRLFNNGATLDPGDLVVVLDTGASSQITAMLEQLRPVLNRTLVIDHHLMGDLEGRWRYIDGGAAACCEIVAELLDALGASFADPVIRDALFVGIAADTGWFRFSNTRPQTHELAARLLRAGVDHADLHARLQQTERPEKLKLMIRALSSLQLLADAKVALMVLRERDFAETGAEASDTEQFVDLPQIVGSVQTVVLVAQPPEAETKNGDGRPIRVSFRSKPGLNAVNVATLAERFGGGGHARAAGARMPAPIDDAVAKIVAALQA